MSSRLPGDSVRGLPRLLFVVACLWGGLLGNNIGFGQEAGSSDWPVTVAESSDWTATSTSAEVEQFIERVAQKAGHLTSFQFGTTLEGRKMLGVIVAGKPYELGQQDGRVVNLVIGNIHSGECAGKEALLMMLRELAQNPDHPWLKTSVLIVVPNYSADSNDRVGLYNRRGQAGPEKGMGRRENAQGLDLNRDFMKLESPEARALVGLIDKVNPHLFVDCHTTNGSVHQYALTYDIPHNPSSPQVIRDFLRQKMMPEVTRRMEEKEGLFTFYYGNFNRNKTAWTTYGHEPRYSTEYVGLRGRLAVLSEAYAYLDYRGRIIATKKFVANLFDYMHENSEAVVRLLKSVDEEFVKAASTEPGRIQMALSAKVKKFSEKFTLKGYEDDRAENKIPKDYLCDFVGNYEGTRFRGLPYAYVFSKEQVRLADRLRKHGVRVERLKKASQIEVEVDVVKSLSRAERAFQKHKMLRLESQLRGREKVAFATGDYVVATRQPLGRLASYLLEPESDDGFAYWNFLDEFLVEGEEYPIYRVVEQQGLVVEPVKELRARRKLTLSMIDGDFDLLKNLPKPARWHGKTNQVASSSWGRTVFVDAETMSFVGGPARLDRRALMAGLRAANLKDDVVRALARSEPRWSDDKRSAVLEAEGYAVVYCEGMGKANVKVLGEPSQKMELPAWNHDETVLFYHRAGNLEILDLKTGEVSLVLAQGEEELVGKLDWVYQEELYGRGNFKAYWSNPVGDQIAYLRLDESPVARYTITDHLPVRGEFDETRYPKAGDPLPRVGLEIADYRTSKSVRVRLEEYGEAEILISRVGWSADGQRLLVQVQNREQTWIDLWSISADGSDKKKLFRDKTKAWIESPGDPPFLKDGSFIWMSPRTGYRHLYHYSAEGELLKPFTSGEWEVRAMLGIDPEEENVYFQAAKNSTEMHLYRLGLKDGQTEQLSKEPGTHQVSFSHDFRFYIDVFSTWNEPARSRLYRRDGTFVRELDGNSDDRLDFVELTEPELVEIPTDSGQPMDGMLIKPRDFDPKKKYPLLVHVYGGPQTPRVRNRFGGEWYLWHQMLAQQGVVVWICDNRSASYRSAKNAWPIHKNLAAGEFSDIERGLDWLVEQGFVDEKRIGIWGWSYGGYMTAYAMTHSERFCCGISGAPVTDWRNYDAIYTERYMGLPKNNAEGYEATSILPSAKKLFGKMLLIHGTIDDNVHLSNTLQLVEELQKAGKKFDLMLYPANRHAIRKEFQKRHLRQMMSDYIFLHLRLRD